jgi:hypothetical protein
LSRSDSSNVWSKPTSFEDSLAFSRVDCVINANICRYTAAGLTREDGFLDSLVQRNKVLIPHTLILKYAVPAVQKVNNQIDCHLSQIGCALRRGALPRGVFVLCAGRAKLSAAYGKAKVRIGNWMVLIVSSGFL